VIDTEQVILVAAPIGNVWAYASDMQKWAKLMPGMREFTVIDSDDSRWTLKVGVGGLVRTVTVLVHVDRWDGPERVLFSYTLEGDPVQGGGTYTATRKSAQETEVTLRVNVEGTGPLAPMWEAMGRPLLPQLAKSFAASLKTEIETEFGATAVPDVPSPCAAAGRWLRRIWQRMMGKRAKA
jgi:carbon monoxide dehydrogenase subunit G